MGISKNELGKMVWKIWYFKEVDLKVVDLKVDLKSLRLLI